MGIGKTKNPPPPLQLTRSLHRFPLRISLIFSSSTKPNQWSNKIPILPKPFSLGPIQLIEIHHAIAGHCCQLSTKNFFLRLAQSKELVASVLRPEKSDGPYSILKKIFLMLIKKMAPDRLVILYAEDPLPTVNVPAWTTAIKFCVLSFRFQGI